MGSSIKRQAKRTLALLLSVCLILGLNPAAALAADYTAGVGNYSDHTQNLSEGATPQTDVKVSVATNFAVQLDNTAAISIDNPRKLANGEYSIAATFTGGVGGSYSYYWSRQVWVASESDSQGGSYVQDEAYNEQSQNAPKTVAADADGVAHVALNLADDAASLDLAGNARYIYTVTARDDASISRTANPGVVVSCNTHYQDQTITADGIGVRGLIHVGDPKLSVTDLMAIQSPSMNMLLDAAAGLKIDSAYDLSITEQTAHNHGEAAYLTPLTSVRIPVSSSVGAQASVLRFITDDAGVAKVETLNNIAVHEENGVRFVQLEGLDNLAASVFAVAYEDNRPKVKVTSGVAEQADGTFGGSISPQGEREYAQGTQVRFVFLPDEGHELEKVVITEGDVSAPVSTTTYNAGALELGPNYLDYTTKTGESVPPVHIFAYFKKTNIGDTTDPTNPISVTASVGNGEGAGSVSIEGGTQTAGGSWIKSVLPGSSVSITFNPEPGSVLDYIEVKKGTAPNQSIERPAVLNSVYTIAAVTDVVEVVAHFKFGTSVVYPLLNVKCDSLTQHGTITGGGQVYYGNPAAVQVRPDSGYKLESIWYTTDSNPTVKHPLREAGSGSYVIDVVLENCTVSAIFAQIASDEKTVTWNITSGTGGSTDPSGSTIVAASSGALPVQITPSYGYIIDSITLNGTALDLSDSKFKGDVYGGTLTLPVQENGGGTLHVTFKERPLDYVVVNVMAGNGGSVSPSGEVRVEVGKALPLSLIPEENKRVSAIELTFKNADGTTYTQKVPWSGTNYTIPAVSENLVLVKVVFEDAPDEQPPNTLVVTPKISAASTGTGRISPERAVEVAENSSALFTFMPDDECEVGSVLLDGAEIAGAGASYVFVDYSQLAALGGSDHTLEVVFVKKISKPTHVDVNVEVQVKVDAAGNPQAPGGTVSPAHVRVPYNSANANYFYLYPDTGYKLVSLKASVNGGAQIDLSYSTKFAEGAVNNMSASQRALSDASSAANSDNSSVAALAAASEDGVRHYVFALSHITDDVDVVAEFAPLAADDTDNAIGAEDGKYSQVSVSSGQGGFISPEGTLTFPVGAEYPFYVEPASAEWSPAAITLTYADGTKELITDVSAGYNPILIKEGLSGIHVTFEHTGYAKEEVTVNAAAKGTGGSISPEGRFQARKGTSQTFTFTYNSARTYIKSLTLSINGESHEVGIWEYATSYTIPELVGNTDITVEFAEAPEKDNPNTEEKVEYVSIKPVVSTDGVEGDTTGGTIEPLESVKVVKGVGAQRFLLKPASGYILESASVVGGGQTYTLSAYELSAHEYLVANVASNTVIKANFVPRTYTVNIEAGVGGSLYLNAFGQRIPQGSQLSVKVRQGMKLDIDVEPADGFELDSFGTEGPIIHEGKSVARESSDANSTHVFTVAGSGSVKATFKQTGTQGPGDNEKPGPGTEGPEGPSNPSDPNNPANPDDPNNPATPAGQVVVTSSSSGHGTISPDGAHTYNVGATAIYTLKPDLGYQPVSVTIVDDNGEQTVAVGSTTYTMTVDRTCKVVANFQPIASAGSNSNTAKTLRTLQSLAKTGDNALIMLFALAAIACGATGFAIVSRRRKCGGEEG